MAGLECTTKRLPETILYHELPNFRSHVLSLPGAKFHRWNFCSLELSSHGTFALESENPSLTFSVILLTNQQMNKCSNQ